MEERLVVDASALLAIYFEEARSVWVADQLNRFKTRLVSVVTLTEVLIRVRDKRPERLNQVETNLLGGDWKQNPVDSSQALVAAKARHLYPLNLGDCFVYALAKVHDAPVLTLDADFKACDVTVILPPKV